MPKPNLTTSVNPSQNLFDVLERHLASVEFLKGFAVASLTILMVEMVMCANRSALCVHVAVSSYWAGCPRTFSAGDTRAESASSHNSCYTFLVVVCILPVTVWIALIAAHRKHAPFLLSLAICHEWFHFVLGVSGVVLLGVHAKAN